MLYHILYPSAVNRRKKSIISSQNQCILRRARDRIPSCLKGHGAWRRNFFLSRSSPAESYSSRKTVRLSRIVGRVKNPKRNIISHVFYARRETVTGSYSFRAAAFRTATTRGVLFDDGTWKKFKTHCREKKKWKKWKEKKKAFYCGNRYCHNSYRLNRSCNVIIKLFLRCSKSRNRSI